MKSIGRFLIGAIISTAVTLAVIFALNRFTFTRGVIQAALR